MFIDTLLKNMTLNLYKYCPVNDRLVMTMLPSTSRTLAVQDVVFTAAAEECAPRWHHEAFAR